MPSLEDRAQDDGARPSCSGIRLSAGKPGALTTAEKEELARLRKENRQLRMEREILKKAAAFFAKESK